MPYNPFDDISDDEWKAAAKPAPVSSNPFDAISDDEWQAAAVKPKKQKNLFSLGATVRGVARGADSIVGGIEKFVPESRRFFDANKQQVGERLSEPVNFDPFKAFSADPGDYELAKRAATTLGGARVLDSALNFLPNVYDAAMVKPRQVMDALGTAESLGMPIDPLVRSRFQSLPRSRVAQALYANSPEYQRLAEKYPGTFEAQQAVSQTVMPVPGRAGELLGQGSVLNKNFLTRTADAALSQGAIGAGQALENANLKGQEASAGDILAGFAGGAVLGGGFNALGEGAGKVVDLVGKAIKRRKFTEIAERAKDPAIAQQVLGVIDRQIAAGQIDMSDPEIAAAVEKLRGQVPVTQELSTPGIQEAPVPEPQPAPTMGQLADDLAGPSAGSVDVDPYEIALARVRNAPNERALQAAIEEASKLIPKGAPKDYKKLLRGRLNDAYNTYQDRISGKVLSGGVEEVQAPPAQDPLSAMRQEETANPMPAAEPGASNDYQPKRRLSESEAHDLVQKEYQLFPQHNFPILMYNRGKGTGHSIRVSPKNLTDEVLDQTLEYGEASLKMKSFPSHDKTRIRKEMQAVLDEKMRREFRRSQNLTEDWEGGIEDMSYHSPERLADIIGNGAEDDPRVLEASHELISRNTRQAPAQENPFDAITDEEMKAAGITPEVVPVEGNARRLLEKKEGRRNVGYMQAEDGVPLSDLPQTLQGQVREHTQAAARAKEIEQQLEWLNDDIYKLLGGDGQEQVKYGAFTYKPRKIEVVLSGIAEALKNKIVDALAHGTKDEVKYATRTVVSNPQDWVQRIDPRMEVDELNNVVKGLKDELSRLDKVLKEQRRGLAAPLKGMAVNDTLEINGKSVRVSVKQVNNRMERELSPEAKELVKKWEDRVKALAGKYTKTKDSGMVPGKSSSPNVRIAQALLTGGGAALTQTNAAFAADGRPMSEEDRKVGAMVRAAGWLLLAGGTLPLMKATLRGKYGKVVSFFEDTLGHAEKLDEFLGLKGKDGLFWKINEHNAAAAQASWGVKFDSQNQKAEALGLLTSGKITANQALDPTLAKGTPFEHMSQEQKAAVIAYWASRKTLGAKVREYNAMLKSKLDDPNLTPAQRDEIERLHGQAITAVQNLDTSLNSRGLKPTQLEEMLVNRAAANVMDAFFLWNPQHHALNTLDSVIMGTFGFGAKRMLRAQADMANPRVRKLMEDSNLFGSFRAERTNIAATAQQNRGPVNFEDLGSDTFNANRVALMAWSEYFDLNRNNIPARDYLEMVEKLLSNQLPQDQAMDAWVHMMERSSRFLGVDPLRVNKNALQQGTLFKLVMSFASQPMRVARLMHHYNQKGDYAALARLTSILVLIGGTAAIPKEVQIGMEYLDPDGAQVVEATLNGISVPGMVANNIPGAAPFVPALNEKLEISPTAPIAFGAMNIAGGVVGQAAGGLMKAAVSASRGDTEGAIRDGYKGAKGALQAAVPRIGPIPVGESIRLGEDIAESATGKMKYHNFLANPFNPGDSKRIGGGEIDLDKIPGGRGMPLVDHLAPGIPAVIYQQKKAETADYLAKKAGNKGRLQMDDVNIAGLRFPMSWNDPLKGLAKSK